MYLEELDFENHILYCLIGREGLHSYCSGFVTYEGSDWSIYEFKLRGTPTSEVLVAFRRSANISQVRNIGSRSGKVLRIIDELITGATFSIFFDIFNKDSPDIEDIKFSLSSGRKIYFDRSDDPLTFDMMIAREIA